MGLKDSIEDEEPAVTANPHPYFDKRYYDAPAKASVNKFPLLPEFLKGRGLVKQHLDSFNYFVNVQIKKIVRANSMVQSLVQPNHFLRFKDIRVGEPSLMMDGASVPITPHTCRLSDVTYAAPIYVDVEYCNGGPIEQKMSKKDLVIGRLPIMLRSSRCVLFKKDDAELARLGECPLDPGGYFVIKGTEKVLLMQEQLSKNRIIIDTDRKGNIIAAVTSSSEEVKSKTVIVMEKGRIFLELNQFTKKVPIMVVMKAMGMETDQEVVQMVGRDPEYTQLLLPSLEDCVIEKIFTREQALEFLETRMKKSFYSQPPKKKKVPTATLR